MTRRLHPKARRRPGPGALKVGHHERPLFSVVICTRNRGASVVPAARSVLATRHPSFELLVVDQSDDASTQEALAPLLSAGGRDPLLRFFHLSRPGKSNALNVALRHARGRFLALTDDDCECDSEWLRHVERAFERDLTLGCVFGEVRAAPHDSAIHSVSINHIPAPLTIRAVRDWLKMPGPRNFGIGAAMVLPAAALDAVGGWDPCIGPGTAFGSGDDHDLVVRLLLHGYGVHLCPEAQVVHHGLRPRQQGAAEVERIGRGFGACFAKYLRCRVVYYGSLRMLAFFLRRAAVRLFKSERGLSFVRGWACGFGRGLFHRLDHAHHLYVGGQVPRTATEAAPRT
ncbi:MAG: glycosyltransferase family 2 protein [Armatimonadetes bacterium]|nr:glycosyltransferase family 2 protein [Armatimonadota bacterium]